LHYFIGFLNGDKMVHEAVVALRFECAARGNHQAQYLSNGSILRTAALNDNIGLN
jgi:hypothetical protein